MEANQLSLFSEPERQAHCCHADGCDRQIDPRFLMCPGHWAMVPRSIQRAIWAHYRPGQEIDKTPTKEYLLAARAARAAVRDRLAPDLNRDFKR